MAFLINLGVNSSDQVLIYAIVEIVTLKQVTNAWPEHHVDAVKHNKNKILKYHAKRLFKDTQNQSGLVLALNPFVDNTNYYYYDTDKISK